MKKYLIRNIKVINEGKSIVLDVLIADGRIKKLAPIINLPERVTEIDGTGKWLIPGVIDDQVHFREPGLTHKATIYSESRAAIAGGVTSFMEMPNTVPNALTQELLEDKYSLAARSSLANYSFFMGTANNNADEVLRTNDKRKTVCGIKIFMGSSTGNMLVDNYITLNKIFSESELLIATHCEDEKVIRKNRESLTGIHLQPIHHPVIRNAEACFESSYSAVQLAHKHGTRLHILHISTARELQLFGNMMPLKEKRITAEVCVHHLHFTANDYSQLGYQIKCNPAIKAPENKAALWEALLDDRLDIIATDHAPHTIAEKGLFRNSQNKLQLLPELEGVTDYYDKVHSGLPLVQHSLPLMVNYVMQGKLTIEKLVEKMCHAVADCFEIANRGYIREGYYADLVIIDPLQKATIEPHSLHYACGWSPFEGQSLPSGISHVFVNGHLAYGNFGFNNSQLGSRLKFER